MVLIEPTVKFVSAGFRLRDNLRRGCCAVLGLVIGCEHTDFADRVRRPGKVAPGRNHAALAHHPLLHGDPVQDRLVTRLQTAIYSGVERAAPSSGDDTGHQDSKLG